MTRPRRSYLILVLLMLSSTAPAANWITACRDFLNSRGGQLEVLRSSVPMATSWTRTGAKEKPVYVGLLQTVYGGVRLVFSQDFASLQLHNSIESGARLSFRVTSEFVNLLRDLGAIANPEEFGEYDLWYSLRVPSPDYTALRSEVLRPDSSYLISSEFTLEIWRIEGESQIHFETRVERIFSAFFDSLRTTSR